MDTFKNLISYLKFFKPFVLSSVNKPAYLKTIVHLRQPENYYREDTLYIGYISDVYFSLRFAENGTFFLIGEKPIGDAAEPNGNRVVLFPETTPFDALMNECQKFIGIQRDLYEASYELTQTYLENDSPEPVIRLLSHMLDNPVMVIDNSYRVLYEHGSSRCNDVVWLDNIKKGYCSYEFVAQFNKINEIRSIQSNDAAFMSGCLDSPLRRCICRLGPVGSPFAHLLAIELNSSFTELKMQILRVASQLLTRSLLPSDEHPRQNSSYTIDNIFIDMLSGKLQSKDILKNCLFYSDIPLESEYYLVSIDIQNYETDTLRHTDPLQLLLQSRTDYVLSACYQTYVVLLVQSKKSIAEMFEAVSANFSFFSENHLTAAISDKFFSLENTCKYFNQTLFVHRIVKQLDLGKIVCTYDNLRIVDVITTLPTRDNCLELIGPEVSVIYDYDRKHNTEYLKTLYYYIRWNRRLSKAADALYIHRNTVSYRVQRAKELFSLNLDDYHTMVHLYIGYLIYLIRDCQLLDREENTYEPLH